MPEKDKQNIRQWVLEKDHYVEVDKETELKKRDNRIKNYISLAYYPLIILLIISVFMTATLFFLPASLPILIVVLAFGLGGVVVPALFTAEFMLIDFVLDLNNVSST